MRSPPRLFVARLHPRFSSRRLPKTREELDEAVLRAAPDPEVRLGNLIENSPIHPSHTHTHTHIFPLYESVCNFSPVYITDDIMVTSVVLDCSASRAGISGVVQSDHFPGSQQWAVCPQVLLLWPFKVGHDLTTKVEPSRLRCLETGEDSNSHSSAGVRMQNWFSLNRHLRRSIYEKNRPLSEDDKRETQNEAERDPVVGEGCLLQLQPQPGPAAANAGDPEGKAQAGPLVPDPSAPKDISPEPALPAPVPPEEIMALIQELQAAHEFQSSHFQERRQDLRSCHDCLKSMKILREHLQAVKTRLWQVETRLGIQVPPQELDPEEEQEELSAQERPCDPDHPPTPPLSNGGA